MAMMSLTLSAIVLWHNFPARPDNELNAFLSLLEKGVLETLAREGKVGARNALETALRTLAEEGEEGNEKARCALEALAKKDVRGALLYFDPHLLD